MKHLLSNLSIARKFILLTGVIASGFAIFGVLAYTSLNTVKVNGPLYARIADGKDLTADILPPPEYIIEAYLVAHQMSLPMSREELDAAVAKVNSLEKDYRDRHEFWSERLPDGDMKKALIETSYVPAEQFFGILKSEYIPAVQRGDREKARELLSGPLQSAYNNHRAGINRVVELSDNWCKATEQEVADITATRILILVITALLVLGVTFALGTIFSRLIGTPLRKLTAVADTLSHGDINVDVRATTTDEIGRLEEAFARMIGNIREQVGAAERVANGDLTSELKPGSEHDVLSKAINDVIHSLRALVDEATGLAKAAVDGKLSTRGNADRFQGGYRQIVQGVNDTLDAVITPLTVASDYFERISKGDIPAKITDAYRGDFNAIKNSLNGCIDAVNALVDDAKMLSAAAVDGKLGTRADVNRHRGDFRKVVEGVNATLDAVIGPLNVASKTVLEIGAGHIPAKLSMGFKGDFGGVEKSLNDCIEGLEGLKEGAYVMSRLAVNDLTHTVKGTYKGIFADIASAVNETHNRLTYVQFMVNEISHGEMTQLEKIRAIGHRSEQDELLPSFIRLYESIGRLTSEVLTLTKAATSGSLAERANAEGVEGEFKKVVAGLNGLLDEILKPVEEGRQVLEKMGGGDLTVRMHGEYEGDHRRLKDSINQVAASLEQALGRVTEAVSAAASASSQISSSTEELAAGVQEQTSQSAEVAGAVHEMTKTILENANNASETATVAKKAKESAETGGQVVEQTVSGMRRIADVVGKSALTVKELGKSSDQIGEIITVIDDIADQTNLLALNAAIEAARAGDQGRGFAVVADEVRKLAERTTKATKEIAAMIKKIQEDTHGAVESMETGTKEVENGISLADRAGASLREIVNVSQRVTDMVTQIAVASEQQSSAAEQISKNVEAISTVTSQTASGTQQIAHAAEDLNRLSENLQQLVDKFVISRDAGAARGQQMEKSSVAVRANGKLIKS